MKKNIILLMLFFSTVSISNEIYENIEYDNLNDVAKKYMQLYKLDMDYNFENTKSKLKLNEFIGKNKSAGEFFLEELDDEDNSNISFSINNINILNKTNRKNEAYIEFNKVLNNDGNLIDIGIITGYSNSNYDKNNINTLEIGLNLKTKLNDTNLDLKVLSEYNYSNIKDVKYTGSILRGGAILSYKQELGDLIYIKPSIDIIYNMDLGSKIKFNNTDVNLKNDINLSLGANMKIGLEKEDNDNIYNAYIDLGLEKKVKDDINYILNFKNRKGISKTKNINDIFFDINLGADFVLNKNHKLSLNGGMNISKDIKNYRINLMYQYEN